MSRQNELFGMMPVLPESVKSADRGRLHLLLYGCTSADADKYTGVHACTSESTRELFQWMWNPIFYKKSLYDMWQLYAMHDTMLPKPFHKSLYLQCAMIALLDHFMRIFPDDPASSVNCHLRSILQVLFAWMGGAHKTHELDLPDALIDETRARIVAVVQLRGKDFVFDKPCPPNLGRILNAMSHRVYQQSIIVISERVRREQAQADQKQADMHRNRQHEIHQGYPLPHPELGQPRLGMLQCLYKHCGAKFVSAYELYLHLSHNKKDYLDGFHKSHEDFVNRQGLTPESIREKQITRCPALSCQNRQFGTAEDLVYHFEELGIKPFWKAGWRPRELLEKQPEVKAVGAAAAAAADDVKQIIRLNSLGPPTEPSCAICLDESEGQRVLFLPCAHQPLCFECAGDYQDSRCCLCRTGIIAAIPRLF